MCKRHGSTSAEANSAVDGDRPATTKGQEDLIKRAVTLAGAVLASLLGFTQSGCWCGWVCDVLGDYWARRR